jgi:hypothetical protein
MAHREPAVLACGRAVREHFEETSMIGSKGIPEHDKRWLGRAVIVFGILATLISMHATAQTAVVSDSMFLNADWTLSQFFIGNAGTVTAAQDLAIGNPAPSRIVTDTVGAAPSPITESIVLGASIYTPFTYNPAVSGAIAFLNYTEDAACTSGCFGSGQSTGPAVLQGGNVYILISSSVITGPGLAFANHALSGLTAADFGLVNLTTAGGIADTTQHPNFSAGGAAMQFGYFRANGSSNGGAGYTLAAAIDNWQVSIFATAPLASSVAVPTLGALELAVLAGVLSLLGFAYLRRVRR